MQMQIKNTICFILVGLVIIERLLFVTFSPFIHSVSFEYRMFTFRNDQTHFSLPLYSMVITRQKLKSLFNN